MKFILSILLIFLAIFSSNAQSISVKSFRIIENDLDARVNYPKRDQNNEVCAIIKVVTTQTGFSFDVGSLGVVATEQKKGEVWVYIPRGVQRITISHSQLGILRNYPFNLSIQTATVYELVLTTGAVTTVVTEPEIESQWLIITSKPEGANVFIDNMMAGTTPFQRRYRVGKYSYRIELPRYHIQAGSITINEDRVRIDVNLKPNFGNVRITSSPENGMAVFLNDNNTGKITPTTLEVISSGEHTIRLIDSWYQPQAKKATVNDEETTFVNFEMKPAFANVTINTTPNASILIDDVLKGDGKWSGRLLEGIYKIKVEKEKHYPQNRTIEVASGKDQTIDLSLNPKTGSTDIATIPIDAIVIINGKEYGTTPLSIKDLTIGEYNLTINKDGFGSYNKKIKIEENKTIKIEENLPDGVDVIIESDPPNSLVTVNGIKKGNTPLSIILGYGKHLVAVANSNESLSKELLITENSNKTIQFTIVGESSDWQRISKSNSISTFEEYQKKYPSSKYINNVEERLLYLKAIQRKDIKFHEEYLNSYPNGDFINEVTDFMKSHYISEGDRFFNSKYYSLSTVNYNKYIKYFPNGSKQSYAKKQLSEIDYIQKKQTKAKIKQDKKNQRLARQTDASFIFYDYDKESYFGLGIGDLYRHKSGWYLKVKTKNFWKDFFIWSGDDYYSNDSYTGKTALWNCYVSGGITYKIFYPLWIYGGLGIGYSMKLYQYDLIGSKYYAEAPNPDYYGWEIFPESGLILKISNKYVLKYSILYGYKNNKGFIHQFGVGLTF